MKTAYFPAALCAVAFGAATTASAQTVTQIPLNYNFNGIVHAGEDLMPDALTDTGRLPTAGQAGGAPTTP